MTPDQKIVEGKVQKVWGGLLQNPKVARDMEKIKWVQDEPASHRGD